MFTTNSSENMSQVLTTPDTHVVALLKRLILFQQLARYVRGHNHQLKTLPIL